MKVYREWTIKFDRKRRVYRATNGSLVLEKPTRVEIEREIDKFNNRIEEAIDDAKQEIRHGVEYGAFG